METDPHAAPGGIDTREYRAITHAGDGRVIGVRALVAQCDAEAIAQVEALVRDFAMDLWDGLRFVEHVAGRHILTGTLFATAGALSCG
jgi:hypothetical protein